MNYNVKKLRKSTSVLLIFAMMLSVVNIAPLLEYSFAFASEESVGESVYGEEEAVVAGILGLSGGSIQGSLIGKDKFTITDVNLRIPGESGGGIDDWLTTWVDVDVDKKVGLDQMFALAYQWEIVQGQEENIQAGDYVEIVLPDGLDIPLEGTTPIAWRSDDGELEITIGHFELIDNKQLIITFNDQISTNTQLKERIGSDTLSGYVVAGVWLDEEEIRTQRKNPIELKFPISDKEVTVKVKLESESETPVLAKKGKEGKLVGEVYSEGGFNPTVIQWMVDVNRGLDNLEGVAVTDIFELGIELVPDSVQITEINVDIDGNFVSVGAPVAITSPITVEGDGTTVKVTLGNISDAYRITYLTKITNLTQRSFSNKVNIAGQKAGTTDSIALANPIIGTVSGLDIGSAIQKSGKTGTALGSTQPYNPETITWTVDINLREIELTAVSITDVIPTGLKLPTAITVQELQHTTGSTFVPTGSPVADWDLNTSANPIIITPPGSTINKAYRITYETEVEDYTAADLDDKEGNNNSYEFKNQATISANELTAASPTEKQKEATVEFEIGNFITKSGTPSILYDSKIITWTIDINTLQQNLGTNVTLEDTIPKGLELQHEDVSIYRLTHNGTTWVQGEAVLSIVPSKPGSGSHFTGTETDRTMEIDFGPITASDTYRVRYTTRITDGSEDDLGYNAASPVAGGDLGINQIQFDNNALLKWNGTGPGPGPGEPGQMDLTKTVNNKRNDAKKNFGAIDYTKKTIDWEIELIPVKEPMLDLKIVDTFPNGGLQLAVNEATGKPMLKIVKGTVSELMEGSEVSGADYQLTNNGTDGLEIQFWKPVGDQEYTITYTTSFDRVWRTDQQGQMYNNTAAFTWDEATGHSPHSTTPLDKKAGYEIKPEAAKNGLKLGKLDRDARQITWELYTNYLSETFTEFTIEDEIQGNQKLIEESIEVYPYQLPEDGEVRNGDNFNESDEKVGIVGNSPLVPGEDYILSVVEESDTDNEKFRIIFTELVDSPYKVVYRTQLVGTSESEYKNTATISGTRPGASVPYSENLTSDPVTLPTYDNFLKKEGVQNSRKSIAWTLSFNRSLSVIEDAVINDELSENNEYIEASFAVYRNTTTGKVQLAKEDYDLVIKTDFATGKQSFELNLGDIVDEYIIEYDTVYSGNESGDVPVSNQAGASGTGTIIQWEDQEQIENVQIRSGWSGAGAGIRPPAVPNPEPQPKQTVTLKKTDGDSKNGIADVEFDLEDGNGVSISATTFKTNPGGTIVINNLAYGTYFLVEKSTIEGYQPLPRKIKIIVDNDGVTVDAESSDLAKATGSIVTIENYKYRTLQVIKTDIADQIISSPQAGEAKFLLERFEDGDWKSVNSIVPVVTTVNGTVTIPDNLSFGQYRITETEAPIGYKKGSPIEFEFSKDGVQIVADHNANKATIENDSNNQEQITIRVPNEVQTGEIVFTKLGADGEPLAGATFELRKRGATAAIGTPITTGKDGIVKFENVEYGDYDIVETGVPVGYALLENPVQVSINADGAAVFENGITEIANILIHNKIIVQKLDFDTRVPLEGAQFRLIADQNNIVVIADRIASNANPNGEIVFENIPYGDYTIVEETAPEGYQKSDIIISVSKADMTSGEIRVEFTNHHQRVVKVTKVRENMPDTKLSGAEFTLTKENDPKFNEVKITDSDGVAEFTGLTFGTYILKETRPPSGYRVNPDFEEIIVFDEPTQTGTSPIYVHELTVENQRRPSGGGGGGGTPPIPEPEKPEEPVKPGEKPKDPTKDPEVPVKPEQPTPEKPVEPGIPEQPTKPGEQKPQEPTIKEETPKETPVQGEVKPPLPGDEVEVSEPPSNGTVTIDGNGKWTYTPEPGFVGTDAFTITIKHADGTEEDVYIEINVGDIPLGAVIPPGVNQLPKTGEINPIVFYALGFGMVLTGAVLLRRNKMLRGKVQS